MVFGAAHLVKVLKSTELCASMSQQARTLNTRTLKQKPTLLSEEKDREEKRKVGS